MTTVFAVIPETARDWAEQTVCAILGEEWTSGQIRCLTRVVGTPTAWMFSAAMTSAEIASFSGAAAEFLSRGCHYALLDPTVGLVFESNILGVAPMSTHTELALLGLAGYAPVFELE